MSARRPGCPPRSPAVDASPFQRMPVCWRKHSRGMNLHDPRSPCRRGASETGKTTGRAGDAVALRRAAPAARPERPADLNRPPLEADRDEAAPSSWGTWTGFTGLQPAARLIVAGAVHIPAAGAVRGAVRIPGHRGRPAPVVRFGRAVSDVEISTDWPKECWTPSPPTAAPRRHPDAIRLDDPAGSRAVTGVTSALLDRADPCRAG